MTPIEKPHGMLACCQIQLVSIEEEILKKDARIKELELALDNSREHEKALRKCFDAHCQQVKELEIERDNALQDVQEWKETNEQNYKAYIQYYKECDKLKYESLDKGRKNTELQAINDELRNRIKELEDDKLRQENYCESLVNENKRLNEIIISKDMVGAELHNENKALRHNLEDWKAENEALKARIKELEDENNNNSVVLLKQSDRIKELEASQPKWISVKDRLPEEEKEILFTDGAYITIGEMWGYEEKYFQEKSACIWNGVTHWMPLPQPPKSED